MEGTPKEELTPEFLMQQIQELREHTDKKIEEYKHQLEVLITDNTANDGKRNAQIVRIAMLIDTAMDNIHSIISLLAEINDKLSIHDQQIWSHGNSISINKRNLNELSKYLKTADKAWSEARKVLNTLSDENDKNITFRWAIGIFVGLLGLVCGGVAFSNSLKALWTLIFGQ